MEEASKRLPPCPLYYVGSCDYTKSLAGETTCSIIGFNRVSSTQPCNDLHFSAYPPSLSLSLPLSPSLPPSLPLPSSPSLLLSLPLLTNFVMYALLQLSHSNVAMSSAVTVKLHT